MNPKKLVYTITIIIFSGTAAFAQAWRSDTNTFDKNWNFTIQLGRTALLSEINKDFSGVSNDMNNQSDWGFNLQLAKMVIDHLDLGFEFGLSNYKGYRNYSGNVNWLMLHTAFNNSRGDYLPLPIYYDSDVTNFSIYLKYNFANFHKLTRGYLNINLYAKVAVGVLFPSVEMGFQDNSNYALTGLVSPLYLKGRNPRPEKDSHFIMNPALGLNYQLSDRLLFSAETSMQLIGSDNLDGIHNFNTQLRPTVPDQETPAYRIPVYDLTAKFMVGMTYYFNIDNHKGLREKASPWHTRQQQFFFSQFHKSSTKKKQENPFGKPPKSKNSNSK